MNDLSDELFYSNGGVPVGIGEDAVLRKFVLAGCKTKVGLRKGKPTSCY